jgi:hypothetical protein
MDGSVRQLRSTVRRLARGKHPNAVRYPASVRGAIVALARTRLGQGQSLARVARGVGVSFPTLASWLGGPAQPALRPVTIVPAAPPPAKPASSLVLVTPHGVRVEGLDGDTLVAVLRALA